jgi:hypothetical protein
MEEKHMSIEQEAINAAAADELRDEIPAAAPDLSGQASGPQFKVGDLLPDLSFLLAPTGDGPVEDYIDHPMNIKGSRGSARILRRLTGMLGQLNDAIVDIALGSIEVMREGKQAHAEAADGK